MGISNVFSYRGYQVSTVVHPASPASAGYVGYVSVEFHGGEMGKNSTNKFSKFQFAEEAARELGLKLVDIIQSSSPDNEPTIDESKA